MQSLAPIIANKERIYDLMDWTHKYRHHQIETKGLSPTDVFASYPRMADTDNGNLVYIL